MLSLRSEILTLIVALSHPDCRAIIHIMLRCLVIAKQLVHTNRDPRSSDCAPAGLKNKVMISEPNSNREFQKIFNSWYLSTRAAALSNHFDEIRAMGVDPAKSFPVEIPIPKAVMPPH